jgi:tetratricopeptide (TPR) repeat protein
MPRSLSHSSVALLILSILTISFMDLGRDRNQAYQNEVVLWEDTIRRSPRKQRTHHNYGCALSRAGRYEDAIKALNRALALENDGSILLRYLFIERGNAYYHLGRHEDALDSWQKGLGVAPGDPEILTNIAVVLLKQGRTEDARRYARTALAASQPFAETLEVMGEIALMDRSYSEAAFYLTAAIRKKPDLLSAYRSAALALEKMHDYDAAYQIILQYLARAGDGPERNNLIAIGRRLENMINSK